VAVGKLLAASGQRYMVGDDVSTDTIGLSIKHVAIMSGDARQRRTAVTATAGIILGRILGMRRSSVALC